MNCGKIMLIAGLLFLLSSCVSPVPSSNLAQVKGVLIEKTTRIPIKGAVLRLWKVVGVKNDIEVSSAENLISETKTDATGAFLFTNVPPDRYVLDGVWEVESGEAFLNLGRFNGNKSSEEPAIDVGAGQIIDLGILEDCPYQYCSLPPTAIPTAIR